MNIESPPEGWEEISEAEFRLILDACDWYRDAIDNFYNDNTGEMFAVRIGARIWVKPPELPASAPR